MSLPAAEIYMRHSLLIIPIHDFQTIVNKQIHWILVLSDTWQIINGQSSLIFNKSLDFETFAAKAVFNAATSADMMLVCYL